MLSNILTFFSITIIFLIIFTRYDVRSHIDYLPTVQPQKLIKNNLNKKID